MSPALVDVLAAAESLSTAERLELVELLLDKLDEPADDEGQLKLTAAWQQEIARRSAEYDAGRAGTVAWHEIHARWQPRRTTDG